MEALRGLARELRCPIWFNEDISPLRAPIKAGSLTFPNRIAIQPMEGADADIMGSPTDQTKSRYLGYAEGCAGIIWFEACSIGFHQSRTHNKMLVINEENLPEFKILVADVKRRSEDTLSEIGLEGKAALIIQLSHAGRYRVERSPASPAMAYRFPVLDEAFGIT